MLSYVERLPKRSLERVCVEHALQVRHEYPHRVFDPPLGMAAANMSHDLVVAIHGAVARHEHEVARATPIAALEEVDRVVVRGEVLDHGLRHEDVWSESRKVDTRIV